ncbi:MAG TPA: PTS system mannose/fructose/sorbose family transporter subunit IID [Longimicrobiales bacterium]
MSRLGWRVWAAVLLRSFSIQASWNYQTLLGHGFVVALLPALRSIYRDDPDRFADAVQRHARLFNSHPYLAPMALGAVARLEAEGADPLVIERFKTAVRGSLGTIGDRLVWAGWRPVSLLFALALLMAGAAWWVAVAGFLLLYNAGHLLLRLWSYRLGWREGTRVGEHMRRSGIAAVQRALPVVGAFLVGLAVPLAAAGRPLAAVGLTAGNALAAPWVAAAAVAALLGVRFGARVRRPVVLALLGFTLFGLLMRLMP